MACDMLSDIYKDCMEKEYKRLADSGMTEEEIEKQLLKKDAKKIFGPVIKRAADDLFNDLKAKMFEISAEQRAFSTQFIANQELKWGRCFAASEAMYKLAIEIGEDYGHYVVQKVEEETKNPKVFTYLTLQHIHGRACQEFLEILYLMKLGFADGAYARWRSMYELACISAFIKKHGEQIAKQYWEQSETQEKQYEWADGAIASNGKPRRNWNFRQIQEDCETYNKWHDSYRLACFVNHGSPQGTFKRMSNGEVLGKIPVGQCDYGITTPAIQSAWALQWITTQFVTIFPYADGLAFCKMFTSWAEMIQTMYIEADNEIFHDLYERQKKNRTEGETVEKQNP